MRYRIVWWSIRIFFIWFSIVIHVQKTIDFASIVLLLLSVLVLELSLATMATEDVMQLHIGEIGSHLGQQKIKIFRLLSSPLLALHLPFLTVLPPNGHLGGYDLPMDLVHDGIDRGQLLPFMRCWLALVAALVEQNFSLVVIFQGTLFHSSSKLIFIIFIKRTNQPLLNNRKYQISWDYLAIMPS